MKKIYIYLKALLLLYVLFILPLSCVTEVNNSEINWKSFQITEHILQSYHVLSIAFDSRGDAWIGTFRHGLIKYSNGNVSIYNSTNSILPDSLVMWDIAVDKKDNIWIGTGEGLYKFDREKFEVFNTKNSPLAEDVVWSIAVDDENSLWLASCRFKKGGLMKFDGKNWTLYNPQNSNLPYNSVKDIAVDDQGDKWIAMSESVSRGTILRISGDNWTIYDKEAIGFSLYYLNNLSLDNYGNVYISVDYMLSSLMDYNLPNIVKYNGRSWNVINPVDENGESLGYVGKVQADLYGNLWTTTNNDKGCYIAAYNGRKWQYRKSDFGMNPFCEIAVDKDNRKWFGSGNGIYIFGN